ncbi:MAG: DUF4190 domain-containing protein [Gemmataceae bacterium]
MSRDANWDWNDRREDEERREGYREGNYRDEYGRYDRGRDSDGHDPYDDDYDRGRSRRRYDDYDDYDYTRERRGRRNYDDYDDYDDYPRRRRLRRSSGQDGQATASMVLGLCSILAWCIPLIGLPVTIIGIVLGCKSMNSERRGQAITGVVLCSIFLIATLINAVAGALMVLNGNHPLING